jgi:hypothetical protein
MPVSFETVHDVTLNKMRDYVLLEMKEGAARKSLDGHLKSAAADFQRICRSDLSFHETARAFLSGLAHSEIEVLALGSVYHWFRANHALNADNYRMYLSTKDYQFASSANLAFRTVDTTLKTLQNDFKDAMNRYSYGPYAGGGDYMPKDETWGVSEYPSKSTGLTAFWVAGASALHEVPTDARVASSCLDITNGDLYFLQSDRTWQKI